MRIKVADLSSVETSIQNIWIKYVNKGLTYGWKSNNNKDYDFGHWNNAILPHSKYFLFDHGEIPFIQKHPEIMNVWNEIQNQIGKKVLVRAYINAYTYGTDAYYHVDDEFIKGNYGESVVSKTAIVYLNNEWKADWGGETSILNDDNEIEYSVLPKKCRALIFGAKRLHSARPLSRCCPVLRAVLVFKMTESIEENKVISFILNKTKNVSHSGKTFFEHLMKTCLILENYKQRESLCTAGLYHSVYGTEFFNFDKSSEFTRETVKDLIGVEAENIVYHFCSLKKDRYETILENKMNYNSQLHKDLLYLEFANLIEQNDKNQYDKEIFLLKQEIDKKQQ